MPSWQKVGSDSIESAAADKRPIVLYFADENDNDFTLYGDDFAELSRAGAMFMKVAYTDDREESPWAEKSVVPTSKLLSENPSLAYDIPVGKATVLVCDWYGNEFFRTDTKVRCDKLQAMVEKVSDLVEKESSKLQKNVDKAKEYQDKGDTKNVLKYVMRNFDGQVGWAPIEESIRMYHDVMDTLRAQKDEMVEKGDVNGLKEMAKIVKKTDLEKEVDEAIDAAAKVKAENPETGK